MITSSNHNINPSDGLRGKRVEALFEVGALSR